MILSGKEIARQREAGRLVIEPFNEAQVNPNSYNFRLGSSVKIYDNAVLDVKTRNPVSEIPIPDEGLVLSPERIYLGYTEEVMGSEAFVPIIRARSGVARLGLFVHVTADLIDIGSVNQWTLQLHAVQPLRIYRAMEIGQVTFWEIAGVISLYDGKYQGSRGAVESHSFKDFE